MYGALLESYQQLQQDMAAVAAKWQECERRIDDYVDEQVGASLDPLGSSDDDWPVSSCGDGNKNVNPVFFLMTLVYLVNPLVII